MLQGVITGENAEWYYCYGNVWKVLKTAEHRISIRYSFLLLVIYQVLRTGVLNASVHFRINYTSLQVNTQNVAEHTMGCCSDLRTPVQRNLEDAVAVGKADGTGRHRRVTLGGRGEL